jgi:hypothetical protein
MFRLKPIKILHNDKILVAEAMSNEAISNDSYDQKRVV